MNRNEVAEKLGAYYSAKFTRETGQPAEVRSYYDETKRAYCIQGERLPAHPNLRATYSNGWTMIDYVKPTEARRLIGETK